MAIPRFFTSKELSWPTGSGAVGLTRVICEDDRLRVLTLEEAMKSPKTLAAVEAVTRLADRRPSEVVAWQEAAANEVVVIVVPGGVALTAPVRVLQRVGADAARGLLIVMEEGSRASVSVSVDLEDASAADDVQMHLETGAVLEVRRLITGGGSQYAVARAVVGTEAHLAWTDFHAGRGFQQSLSEFRLDGRGATARYRCGAVGSGGLLLDEVCRAIGTAAETKSDLRSWSVLSAGDKVVSGGRVTMHQSARGAAGHQRTHALLLERGAFFAAQPDLEAEHDDLTGGHGAAISGLDEEGLFYLQSRGLEAAVAQRTLAAAFLDEVAADYAAAGLEERVSAIISESLR
jgi:Fe-S cluster assembly scaffold protein SufB